MVPETLTPRDSLSSNKMLDSMIGTRDSLGSQLCGKGWPLHCGQRAFGPATLCVGTQPYLMDWQLQAACRGSCLWTARAASARANWNCEGLGRAETLRAAGLPGLGGTYSGLQDSPVSIPTSPRSVSSAVNVRWAWPLLQSPSMSKP